MMFRTIIHIALLFVLVEGFRIVDVEPTTIPQTNATLSITWKTEDGDEDFPIALFLLKTPGDDPSDPWKGNKLIDNDTKNPIEIPFPNLPTPEQRFVVAFDGNNKQIEGDPFPITVTGPPTSSNASTPASTSKTTSTSASTNATDPSTFSTSQADSTTNTSTISSTSSESVSSQNAPPTTPPSTPTPSSSPPTPTSSEIDISSPGSQEPVRSRKSNTGTIIGSVIGGLAFIAALLALIFLYLRRRRSKRRVHETDEFFKEKMVKQPDDTHYPFATAYSPSHEREPSREEQVPALKNYSRESSPTPSAHETTITAGDDEATTRVPSRTDRQMEIEERIQQLEAQLITLYDKSRVPRSQGRNSPEEIQMGEVRGKIERLQVLKNSDWALELSDERPPDMM